MKKRLKIISIIIGIILITWIIINSTPDEVDMDKIEVLMTTDENSEVAVLLRDGTSEIRLINSTSMGKMTLDLINIKFETIEQFVVIGTWYS